MQEDPLVRSARRDLSRQLTADINNSARFPAVRAAVLSSLSTLWGRLQSLKDFLVKDLGLNPAQPLLYFYMKGGNAFECVINPAGPAATQLGGGASDWDTQVVVDPWAPVPIQDYIYKMVEDLIFDELRSCAVEIASWLPEVESPTELLYQASTLLYRYSVTLDEQQTIRQVFDHNRTGLWLNTQRKMSDLTMPKAQMPGMIFNDGIEPFLLYRLGYTWHAKPVDWPPPVLPGHATGPQIGRPLLMELIDVTLPRRNTVEAVEVWEDFQSGHLAINPVNVSLLVQGATFTVSLPLPSLDYHFNEQALMLCEVAAGVSKSEDKVNKRFIRLAQIYNAVPAQQPQYQAVLAAMAGIPVEQLGVRVVAPVVDNVLNANAAGAALVAAAGTPEYMAVNMMYRVAANPIAYNGDYCIDARRVLAPTIAALTAPAVIAEAGFSDDLALYTTVVRNGYIDTNRFPGSRIDLAAWLRVSDPRFLEDTAKSLRDRLPSWLSDLAAQAAVVQPNATQRWVRDTFFGKVVRVESRNHITLRRASSSLEITLVIFADDRTVACLTLTGAPASEAPFLPDPLESRVWFASVVDMAEQRKVAAAVIKDFRIRNGLSDQLTILNRLFPSIWRPRL